MLFILLRNWFLGAPLKAPERWHSTGQACWQQVMCYPSGHFLWRIYREEINLMSSQVTTRWVETNLGDEISRIKPLADATNRYQSELSW